MLKCTVVKVLNDLNLPSHKYTTVTLFTRTTKLSINPRNALAKEFLFFASKQ